MTSAISRWSCSPAVSGAAETRSAWKRRMREKKETADGDFESGFVMVPMIYFRRLFATELGADWFGREAMPSAVSLVRRASGAGGGVGSDGVGSQDLKR